MEDRPSTEPSGVPEPRPAPEPRKPLGPRATLTLALTGYIVVSLAYGLPMLLWPDLLWDTVAGVDEPTAEILRSLRWAGGVLTGMGAGAFFVMARPKGQRGFVTAVALHVSVAGVAILYSTVAGELDFADAWFRWVSAIVTLVLALYMWIARRRAREILAV